MTEAHTPAPWGYRRHLPNTFVTDDPHRIATQEAWYIHGPKSSSDFLADVFVKNYGNSEADVKLMVAAPELLKACQNTLEAYKTLENLGFNLNRPCFHAWREDLEAAIKKATGGQI